MKNFILLSESKIQLVSIFFGGYKEKKGNVNLISLRTFVGLLSLIKHFSITTTQLMLAMRESF